MGLVLRPSEKESGVQQIRSELNNMKDGYSGVMQTVLGFRGMKPCSLNRGTGQRREYRKHISVLYRECGQPRP